MKNDSLIRGRADGAPSVNDREPPARCPRPAPAFGNVPRRDDDRACLKRQAQCVRATVATFAVLLCVVLAGCGGNRSAGKMIVAPSMRSCGFQNLGKGWYLRATRSLSCGRARTTFERYFSARGCNGTATSTCSVGAYRCRYDYRDDVERVRCAAGGRLIGFKSLP